MPREATKEEMITQLMTDRGRTREQGEQAVAAMIEHKLITPVPGTNKWRPTQLGSQYYQANKHRLNK